MLIQKKISSTKRSVLLGAVVLIVGITIYLLYDRYSKDSGVSIDIGIKPVEVSRLPNLDTSFSSDFINKRPYTLLEQNGRLPVQPSVTGRPNPFAEIPFALIGG